MKYPQEAIAAGEEAKLWMRFVVGREGELTNVEVIRGPSVALNKEAERAVKAMPRWTPSRQNGKAVAVVMTLPVDLLLAAKPEER